MSSKPSMLCMIKTARSILGRLGAAICMVFALSGLSSAANIKVVPSSLNVTPGDSFFVDIVVEDVPDPGLGTVQFKMNLDAAGSAVTGVPDTSFGKSTDVSIAAPLQAGPATVSKSGLGEFFLGGAGPSGVLVLDNEGMNSGSGLYTYSHTSGAALPTGSGSVARFQVAVGKDVTAEKINITLPSAMLLAAGTAYPLDSNTGATVVLRCLTTMPDLLNKTQQDALSALAQANLLSGNVYEIDNSSGTYGLNKVLVQSVSAGSQVLCRTAVDLAINNAPTEVANVVAASKTGDETGTVVLSWVPSASSDVGGYRVYRVSGVPIPVRLTELRNPVAAGVEITGLQNGQATQLKITAFDTFGNESDGAIVSAIPRDDVPPRVSITGVADGVFYASDVLPVIDVQDASLASQDVTLNNAVYNHTALTNDGNYTLRVSATDAAGNNTTKAVSFVVDKTLPVIAVTGLEKGRYYNADLAPGVTATDANLLSFDILLNSAPYTGGSTISAENSYQLVVTARDKAGNIATETYPFFIDKTKPTSALLVGTPQFVSSSGATLISGATMLTLSGNDAGVVSSGLARLETRINSGAWSAYQTPLALAGLSDGPVSMDYRGVDEAGNIEDFHTVIMTLDNTPPATTITVNDPKYAAPDGKVYATNTATFTLSATDNLSGVAKTEYRIDGGAWTTYAPFTIPAEGTHTVDYRSQDNVSNLETAKTLVVAIDNTPPTTTIAPGDLKYAAPDGKLYTSGTTTFTLSATDNLSGVAKTEYRIDGSAWTAYAPFTIPAEGTHTIDYRSQDNVSNLETFKTLSVIVDITPPVTSISTGDPKFTASDGKLYTSGTTTFTLTATDNLSGVAKTEYRIDGGAWTPYTQFSIPAEGTHTIDYRSQDNVVNLEAFKTLAVIVDNMPPVTSISVGTPQYSSAGKLYATSATTFSLAASDNLSGVAKTEYKVDSGAWTAYAQFTLSTEGTHTVSYRSIDNVGNVEADRTLAVIIDNMSPVTTIGVGTPQYVSRGDLYVSGNTLLTLSATDTGSGVKKSEYSIDSSATYTTTAGPLNLAAYPDGTHILYYRSVDNLGNTETAGSLTLILDKTPPETSISASDPLASGTVNTVSPKTRFSLSAADSLAGVKTVNYSIDNGDWQTTMDVFSLSGLEAGQHVISYRSTDNVLNEEAVKSITVKLIVINVEKKIAIDPVVLVGVGNDKSNVAALDDLLSSLNLNYLVALTTDDFMTALRSGRYNTYVLMDMKDPLTGEEVREAIHDGDGLIFIKTNPGEDPFLDDVFGVTFKGKTSGSDLLVNLTESPISNTGSILSSGKNVVSGITSTTAQSFGMVTDKKAVTPAIIFNEYGLGRVLLYTFDILSCADKAQSTALLVNSLNYVRPLEHTVRALDSAPIRIKLGNSTEPVDVKIMETLPDGTTADSMHPHAALKRNIITWLKSMGSNENASFSYYLNLPDEAGDYTTGMELEYQNGVGYRNYGAYDLTLTVSYDAADLLQKIRSDLNALTVLNRADARNREAAVEALWSVDSGSSTTKKAEQSIAAIITATDAVRSLSTDSMVLRRNLDELLKIWEKKWYLQKCASDSDSQGSLHSKRARGKSICISTNDEVATSDEKLCRKCNGSHVGRECSECGEDVPGSKFKQENLTDRLRR